MSNLNDRVQIFLNANEKFPQRLFPGKHNINIQVPVFSKELTGDQIADLASAAFNTKDVEILAARMGEAVVVRIETLSRNAANSEATRSSKPGKTANDTWTSHIDNGDVEAAGHMLGVMRESAEIMGYTERQLEELQKELDSIS